MKITRAVIALPILAACAGPPPPPAPALVSVTVSAEPASNGQAPLSVRIYQLTSPAAFEDAQFFALFNGDATKLKDDLIKRDDLLVAPGQSKTLMLTPTARASVIGVFGAYRDYESQSWRAVTTILPNVSSVLTVTSGVSGLSAKMAPAK